MSALPAPSNDTTTPLANVEAEAALLGAMMIDNRMVDVSSDHLTPEDFFEALHGRVFERMQQLVADGRGANPVTLRPFFQDDETMRALGGPTYLAKLSGSPAALIGARDLIQQIADLSRRRRLIASMQEAIGMAQDTESGDLGVTEVVKFIDDATNRVLSRSEATESFGMDKVIRMVVDDQDGVPTGVKSGTIKGMDRAMGPLPAGKLVIVAGRPGMGKTAVAVSWASGVVRRVAEQTLDMDAPLPPNGGVLFFSLEMTALELGQRFVVDYLRDTPTPVLYDRLVHHKLDMHDRRAFMNAQDYIATLPLQIIDRAGLSVGRIRSLGRRWRARFEQRGTPLKAVVIDYLQLIKPDRRSDSRVNDITDISNDLKTMAKELECPVIALSQLSRAVEAREDKRPVLSDLRDSGAIEQDADVICFPYRHEYYLKQQAPRFGDAKYTAWQDSLQKVEGEIEFIFRKMRHGVACTEKGVFDAQHQAVR